MSASLNAPLIECIKVNTVEAPEMGNFIDREYLSEPVKDNSLPCGGGRSRTAGGPAGELIELMQAC